MKARNLEQQPQAPEQRVEELFRRALKFSADLKKTLPEAGQELLTIVAELQMAVKELQETRDRVSFGDSCADPGRASDAVPTEIAAIGTFGISRAITDGKRLVEVRARLMEQVMAAQEEERGRIARDLHDGVSQSLAALVLGLEVMYREPLLASARPLVEDLRRTAATTAKEVRRLARGLRPSVLDDLGLAAALERHVSEYAQAYGIAIHLQTAELGSRRLAPAIETALYRIAQEALANTVKHARAKSISLTVQLRPAAIQMTVRDDGCGFDSKELLRTLDVTRHFGLSSMQERATLLNGTATVASQPGEGTTVWVRIPLEEKSYEQDSGADCR